jgi:hypothetical protein
VSRAQAKARPKRASKKGQVLKRDLLNVAVRPLQLVHAVTTCVERASTHDLVEVACVSDAAAAIVAMVEQVLNALDQLEAISPETRHGN